MRIRFAVPGFAVALALAFPGFASPSAAQQAEKTKEKAEKVADLYRPPARGKPRGRVGGGVRSAGDTHPALYSLVPDHTGLTAREQPSLFWYLDAAPPSGASLVFTLTNEERIDPLVEAELPAPAGAGIQRIELAHHDARLQAGTEYEWSVALVVDPERRSNDVVTAGWIDRVPAPPGLPDRADPASLAAHGLWYDALAAAADQIAAAPDDPAPQQLRDALLREVGLALVPAGEK